jgi:WD40 repeat protein
MIGTSSGTIKLVDLKKNKVIWKESLGGLIFDIEWNPSGIVAIALAQRSLVLRHCTKGEVTKLGAVQLENYSRCLHFCPSQPGILAVGLFGGGVLVYDVDSKRAITNLFESEKRILCV